MSKNQRWFRFACVVVFAFLVITINTTAVRAQTALAPGDIAFSGYICNDAPNPDRFSFVLLKNIAATTTIKFTDYGWRTDANMFTNNGITESEITFTATSALNAGTEITIVGTSVNVSGGGSGIVVYSVGPSFLVGNLNLASTGDQIIAYQGTFPTPTSFISGIHMNVYTGVPSTTTAAAWDGVLAAVDQNNNSSGLPTGLITGTNALWFSTEFDNARFTCGPNVSTAALARAALNNPANWQTNNLTAAGFGLPTGCGFIGQPSAADGSISGVVTTSDGRPLAGVTVNLSGGRLSRNTRTITNDRGQYRFVNVETGEFYTITPVRANYNLSPFNRSFSLVGNQTEAAFTATLTGDNANPLDTPEYFVRQQYLDVMSREPDEAGFNYWSDRILACGDDAQCINARRRDVAAAFFSAEEFQASGSYLYDVYAGALGRRPAFSEYTVDRQQVVGGATLDAAKTAFAQSFVQRVEFMAKYHGATTAESFVDALLQSVQASGVNLSADRDGLITAYQSGSSLNASRAAVVRAVADNATFKQSQYNQAFVLTEYFAYLQRDAEPEGFTFWVNVLNTGDPGNYRGMVCSFVTSMEDQRRFSAVVSHSNGECGQ